MRMIYVAGSSNISHIGYDETERKLAVEFRNGTTYHYADVPADKYAAFLHAQSPGKYFAGQIRGLYEFEKVHPAQHKDATLSDAAA